VKITLGPTPIVRVLRQVLREKTKEIEERNVLVLIATDGAPTDDQGNLKIDELRKVLKYERQSTQKIPVTIIACTGKYQFI
jgi:Mg-chelatase subunit ChlD